MKTITVKIKAPPKGWKHENRVPKMEEEFLQFDGMSWEEGLERWINGGTRKRDYEGGAYAYRVKKASKK